MYPGLTNTLVELPKIVRSTCFIILGIHFITTRKIQEIAFQGFQISKFSRGACPRTPLDGSRLRREIVPPNFNALAPPLPTHFTRAFDILVSTCRITYRVLLCSSSAYFVNLFASKLTQNNRKYISDSRKEIAKILSTFFKCVKLIISHIFVITGRKTI